MATKSDDKDSNPKVEEPKPAQDPSGDPNATPEGSTEPPQAAPGLAMGAPAYLDQEEFEGHTAFNEKNVQNIS